MHLGVHEGYLPLPFDQSKACAFSGFLPEALNALRRLTLWRQRHIGGRGHKRFLEAAWSLTVVRCRWRRQAMFGMKAGCVEHSSADSCGSGYIRTSLESRR